MHAKNPVDALIVLFIIATKLAAANYGVNANAREASMLCTLVSWAGDRSTWAPATENQADEVEDILKLNMSLADDNWKKRFITMDPEPKAVPYDGTAHSKITDSAETWAKWAKQAEETATPQKQRNIQLKLKLGAVGGDKLRAARADIARLAAELDELRKEAASPGAGGKQIDEAEIRKQLNQAVYGQETEPATGGFATKNFGKAAGSREAQCDGTASDPKVTTVLGTLACLCLPHSGANSNNQGKVCSANEGLTNTDWNPATAATPPTTALEALVKICPREGEQPLTAATLAQAVTDTAKLFTYDRNGAYIGIHQGTGCTGANNNGMCVKYPELANAAKDPKKAIKWLSTLASLAENMAQAEAAAVRRNEATRQLNIKARMLLTLVDTATVGKQPAVNGAAQTPAEQTEKPAKQQTDCATHKDNKTACENAKCKREGDEATGKCQPKMEKGRQTQKEQQRAADGSARGTGTSATAGCARHRPRLPVKMTKQATNRTVHLEREKMAR